MKTNKKPTLSTLKAFIKREIKNQNLYAGQKYIFDGMTDGLTPANDELMYKIENVNLANRNTLGINKLYLVGGSRNYIKEWSNSDFIGYSISNCCGSSIIAMKRLH